MKSSTKAILFAVVLVTALGIAILVGLVALLFVVQHQRESVRRDQAINNLKSIGRALHNYEEAVRKFPPSASFHKEKVPFDTYSGYFVSNEFEPDEAESFVVIDSQSQFDKIFGVAAVMNNTSHRLAENAFESLVVLAVVKRGHAVVEYTVDRVTAGDGVLELCYTTTSKENESAFFASPLIVSIPKEEYSAVWFVENNKVVKEIQRNAEVDE